MSKKSGAGPGGKKGNDDDQDVTLQAVVLADSFQNRFRPLTLEKPRCLLPLANVPLIEYTFEFLATAGVEDVYVFCSAHADQIDEYIKTSKWTSPHSGFKKLRVIFSPNSASVGDAMRDLDAKQLITSDFLLVSGDVVSTLELHPILHQHRQRRQADKNAIMTMILRQASINHRTKCRAELGIFCIDPKTDRCVYYEEMVRHGRKKQISIPPELFKRHPQIEIRGDLIDCSIDICSPDVPALFTENFDYQHIRRHFVHGILQDYELYGKTIHCHVAKDNYAARVRSLRTYDAVSKDIIQKWSKHINPENGVFSGQKYQYQRGNIYKGDNVVLGRDCVVKPRTIIGGGTNIGEGSVVGSSVIGRNCKIGKNVVIEGAYIWDSVVVEDGCMVRNSIVADEAVLGSGSTVEDTAVVSYGVKLALGTTVTGHRRLTARKRVRPPGHDEDDEDEDDEDASQEEDEDTADEAVVGIGGKGFLYLDSESEDEDSVKVVDSLGPIVSLEDLEPEDSSISALTSEEESAPVKQKRRRASGSYATSASEENEEDAWHKEAVISLRTALEKNHPVEVAGLELNSLRMASDANWHQVRRAAATAFVARLDDLMEQRQTATVACGQLWGRWGLLLNRMIHGLEDQVDFLLLVQKECSIKGRGGTILLHSVQKLYDIDLIEEEAVNGWWQDERSVNGDDLVNVRKPTNAFITWLAEAESEGEDEDEDEDE